MLIKRFFALILASTFLSLSACDTHKDHETHHEGHKLVMTIPLVKDVILSQQYVCQIHSQRHINVRALSGGFLEPIPIKEGQLVRKGDVLFQILPVLYKTKLDAEIAEVQLAQQEYNNTQRLSNDNVVSRNELLLFQAKLEKAKAKAAQAKAELEFTTVRAPFDGIVDRLHEQQGSLIKEGENLTTLSDNSLMWVYFNVPEARYLEYMANLGKGDESQEIVLELANGSRYKHIGKIGAIEAKFNNETGNIPFRADFPNPERLLRHGQTGNILINRTYKGSIVIPQRATFEILSKRYVWIVTPEMKEVHEGPEGKEVKKVEKMVAHQQEIIIKDELDDLFVIKSGIGPKDKFVLEGVLQVHEGEELEDLEEVKPEDATANLKNHAE